MGETHDGGEFTPAPERYRVGQPHDFGDERDYAYGAGYINSEGLLTPDGVGYLSAIARREPVPQGHSLPRALPKAQRLERAKEGGLVRPVMKGRPDKARANGRAVKATKREAAATTTKEYSGEEFQAEAERVFRMHLAKLGLSKKFDLYNLSTRAGAGFYEIKLLKKSSDQGSVDADGYEKVTPSESPVLFMNSANGEGLLRGMAERLEKINFAD